MYKYSNNPAVRWDAVSLKVFSSTVLCAACLPPAAAAGLRGTGHDRGLGMNSLSGRLRGFPWGACAPSHLGVSEIQRHLRGSLLEGSLPAGALARKVPLKGDTVEAAAATRDGVRFERRSSRFRGLVLGSADAQ